jgi:predicted phosphodiesterase
LTVVRIRALSDLHLEFAPFDANVEGCDLLVLAGDIDVGTAGVKWATGFVRPVIYVAGNHEYYHHRAPGLIAELRAAAEGSEVRVLERDEAIVGGVRFLGATLWTDFALLGKVDESMLEAQVRMSDFAVITSSDRGATLAPIETVNWHRDSVAWLRDRLAEPFAGPTVVVTHHAPSLESAAERHRRDPLSPAFNSHLDDLVDASGAALWIHGHTHHNVDYTIGATRVIANQRGYPGEGVAGFDPGWVAEIS